MEFEWNAMLALVLAILTVATLCRATFGFGDGLIAMPFLVIIMGPRAASPLMAMVGAVTALILLANNYKKVSWSAAWRLVLSSCFGIPVGIYFLRSIPEPIASGALGVMLFAFALYCLTGVDLGRLEGDNWSFPFGFISGCLGGAWNTSGPPIVLYGSFKRWSPEVFRNTLQGYFVMTALVLCVGHFFSGAWTPKVVGTFLASMPLVVGAIIAGSRLNGLLPPEKFGRILHYLLLILGLVLIGRFLLWYFAA